jgi:hypothetical protein
VSRNARISMPRGRRSALNSGLAVGAAAIAASISMGTAPAARADVIGSDAVSDLIGAIDPQAVSAAAVPETQAVSYLIEAFDPNSFSAAGAPTDALGLLGYSLDTYLLVPSGIDTALEPYVVDLVGTITGGSGPPDEPAAVSDLVAALDPEAFTGGLSATPTDEFGVLAFDLDTFLLEPSGIDGLIYPSIEEFINSLPTAAASVVDADPVIDGLLNSVTIF